MPDRRRSLAVWQAMLDRLEPGLRVKAARARTAFLKEAATAYDQNGSVPGWVAERHRRALQALLADHYTTTATRFASLLRRQMKFAPAYRERKGTPFTHRMAEWVSTQSLRKARMIAATDTDDVRDAIQAGIDEGEGTEAIAGRIRKVSGLTPARAATVARTETNAAATFGYMGAAREAETEHGVRLLKVWLPTTDDRTRGDHAAMADHPPIPLDEMFEVGDSLMDRPGDPSAPPDQVINCRCSVAVEEQQLSE